MKYTIIGDIHARTIWRDIVKKEEDSDKIIFLGDYVSTHFQGLITADQQIEELYGILDYKERNKDKIILLRGNHDDQALGYHWAECYPKVPESVANYVRTNDVSRWFLNNTQWIYNIPNTNIICSHAGIGEHFFNAAKNYYRTFINSDPNIVPGIMDINEIPPCELFGFTDDNPFDTSGESKTQPCTWIRPYTLLRYGVKGIVNVVGHTPTEKICNIKEEIIEQAKSNGLYEKYKSDYNEYVDVWCCDNLKNNQYLVIDNDEFIVKTI